LQRVGDADQQQRQREHQHQEGQPDQLQELGALVMEELAGVERAAVKPWDFCSICRWRTPMAVCSVLLCLSVALRISEAVRVASPSSVKMTAQVP
jgi:hypothetical protein